MHQPLTDGAYPAVRQCGARRSSSAYKAPNSVRSHWKDLRPLLRAERHWLGRPLAGDCGSRCSSQAAILIDGEVAIARDDRTPEAAGWSKGQYHSNASGSSVAW